MPFPEYYKTVIARSLERNVHKGLNTMEFAELILSALDLANDIMGNSAVPSPNVLINTLPGGSQTTKLDLSKGLLVGDQARQLEAEIVEEAPPMALVRNPDGQPTPETDEEIETKKSQLHSWILGSLPRSMTLKLPGFDKDIQLNQYVRKSPPKMNFIRVFYTQFPEQEDGPQISLTTSDKNLDPALIKTEIVRQANSRYSQEKRRVEPRIPPPNPMPDVEQMLRQAKYDPSQDVVSPEDREQWNAAAGKNVI